YPVGITCCTGRTGRHARPEWVDRLMRDAEVAAARDAERLRNQPPTRTERTLEAVVPMFVLGALALGLVGLVWPVWGVVKWRGGWRAAAALPAGLTAFFLLRILVDTAVGPTSHNLWPF